MKKFLNNPWVVGALCIVALITVYFRLFDKKSKPEPPITVAQVVPISPVVAESVPGVALSTEETAPPPAALGALPVDVGWPEKFGRDPFQPMRLVGLLKGQEFERDDREENEEGRRPTQRSLRLHAIFFEGSTRMAMINRELVKEGQPINEYVVDRIQQNGVWLTGGEEPRWLEFNVPPVRPRSAS